MYKLATVLVAASSLLIVSIQPCMARGGGGFHGGGGGFHGGGFGGGYRSGNFGGYRGGDFGGYRPGFDGGRSFRMPDNFGALRDGNHDRGAVSGNHSFRQHNPLPSDFGFGHGGARSYLATGHATHPWTNNMMRDRGNTVRNNFWNHNYFNHNWWHDHPGAWFAAGWGAGTAWAWTAWPALGTWYGWGDNVAPVYYDYGTNVVYDNDEVFYGGQPFASADDFYQQASTIANTNLNTDPNQGEWKPLGVFGLVQGEQNNATAMFQLATNKEGTIAGNFCDMLSGNTMQVQGSVDKQTQRAAWTVGDNFDTIYEAGIYNLTQEEAPVLVHFGKERTQQWMLVRLKQPSQAQLQAAPLSK